MPCIKKWFRDIGNIGNDIHKNVEYIMTKSNLEMSFQSNLNVI